MNLRTMMIPAGLVFLGACATEVVEPVAAPIPSRAEQMFATAVAMAGPNQNAQTARLRADDNCFWYRYDGPVETTELPLLTATGRHICGPEEEVAPVVTETPAS